MKGLAIYKSGNNIAIVNNGIAYLPGYDNKNSASKLLSKIDATVQSKTTVNKVLTRYTQTK